MKRLCVFCGSSSGKRPVFADVARRLGRRMALRSVELVFGGGHIGLMGVVADAILGAGGTAIGVIPQALVERELAHDGVTELHVVDTMHQRKALMAEKSDTFLALPGGFGTADELFEIMTWRQLGIHDKPIGILNVQRFFDPWLAWINSATDEGFVRPKHRDLLIVEEEVDLMLDRLDAC